MLVLNLLLLSLLFVSHKETAWMELVDNPPKQFLKRIFFTFRQLYRLVRLLF